MLSFFDHAEPSCISDASTTPRPSDLKFDLLYPAPKGDYSSWFAQLRHHLVTEDLFHRIDDSTINPEYQRPMSVAEVATADKNRVSRADNGDIYEMISTYEEDMAGLFPGTARDNAKAISVMMTALLTLHVRAMIPTVADTAQLVLLSITNHTFRAMTTQATEAITDNFTHFQYRDKETTTGYIARFNKEYERPRAVALDAKKDPLTTIDYTAIVTPERARYAVVNGLPIRQFGPYKTYLWDMKDITLDGLYRKIFDYASSIGFTGGSTVAAYTPMATTAALYNKPTTRPRSSGYRPAGNRSTSGFRPATNQQAGGTSRQPYTNRGPQIYRAANQPTDRTSPISKGIRKPAPNDKVNDIMSRVPQPTYCFRCGGRGHIVAICPTPDKPAYAMMTDTDNWELEYGNWWSE